MAIMPLGIEEKYKEITFMFHLLEFLLGHLHIHASLL